MKTRPRWLAAAALLVYAALSLSQPAAAGAPIYLSPRPGARYVHPETSLAIREGRPFEPGALDSNVFTVRGSRSGIHPGRIALSDDRLTLLFYPHRPFAFDEIVTVTIGPLADGAGGASVAQTTYQFSTVERPFSPQELAGLRLAAPTPPAVLAPAGAGPAYHTHPELVSVMTASVTTPPQQTGGGYLFLTAMNFMGGVDLTNLILDESGEPLYIGLAPPGETVADLKIVQYQGEPHLAYHAGVSNVGWSQGSTYLLDDTYTLVETWTIENGYNADLHDFQVFDNDHVLLMGYLPTPYDLSPYGGPEDGVVYDIVIQEQDTDKNVVFEWHGIDFFNPEDAYINLSVSPLDYIHSNAIEIDLDGHVLLSSRSLSEITKIDRGTGEIIWRLGGKNNDFNFTNDIGFSFQHDIRRLSNGNITLFDNGNQHTPSHTRAVEYDLDESGMTATLVWAYPGDTSIFSAFMGSAQRLENGNTLIGWGGLPLYTEVLPDKTVIYEAQLSDLSYRVFRHAWSALPAAPPRAAVGFSPGPETAAVYASWNGATGIAGYEVYAGPDPGDLSLVANVLRTGFETSIALSDLDPSTCVFQVRPVHRDGIPTPFSNIAYRVDLPGCFHLLDVTYLPIVVRP